MEPQVTNRELAWRIVKLLPAVVVVSTALGYAAGIGFFTLLWMEGLALAFGTVVVLQFMLRRQQPEDYSRERLIFYFVVVPLIMVCLFPVYLWLALPPWVALVGFPVVVLALNAVYSIWGERRSMTSDGKRR